MCVVGTLSFVCGKKHISTQHDEFVC